MNKLLQVLLPVIVGALAVLSPSLRGASLGDGGYARVGVPDLAQAAAFFRDVLDCQPVDGSTAVVRGRSSSQLLACGGGAMLELFVDRDNSPSRLQHTGSEPLQFVSDGALRTDAWLRQRGVVVDGPPHRLTSGPWSGRMALDFVAPWGLRVRLLGSQAREIGNDGGRRMAVAPSSH